MTAAEVTRLRAELAELRGMVLDVLAQAEATRALALLAQQQAQAALEALRALRSPRP